MPPEESSEVEISVGEFADDQSDAEPTQVLKAPNELQRKVAGQDCLVTIYGGPLGRRFVLDKSVVVIGRGGDCDISIKHDTVSRRHARVEGDGASRHVTDLDSTNGVYINGRQSRSALLASGDYVKVGEVIFKYLAGDNIESIYHEEIYRLAIEDGLTRVANKRYLEQFLEREVGRAQRHQRPLTLMMLDIDHFKRINDTHGHLAGDAVLSSLADLIRPKVRREECFARYGGEEFCLVMPETPLSGAKVYAESIREAVFNNIFEFQGRPIRVSVSIGVAELGEDMHTPDDLIQRADERLLQAKSGGRNRVVSE